MPVTVKIPFTVTKQREQCPVAGPAAGSALSSALLPLQPVLLGIDPDLGGALVVLEVRPQAHLFAEAHKWLQQVPAII